MVIKLGKKMKKMRKQECIEGVILSKLVGLEKGGKTVLVFMMKTLHGENELQVNNNPRSI